MLTWPFMRPSLPLSASQRLALTLLPPALALALRGLAASWRVRARLPLGSHPRRSSGPIIYAMWHECIISVTAQWRDHDIQGLASQSFDGSLISATLLRLGYPPPSRGSSSRGGAEALRSHVEALKQGHHVVVTVDGPRGPAHAAKPGVGRMAEASGAPVVAVACAVDARWRLKSWDRTLLPPPFARVAFALSSPQALGVLDTAQRIEKIQQMLSAAQIEAESILSQWPKQHLLE